MVLSQLKLLSALSPAVSKHETISWMINELVTHSVYLQIEMHSVFRILSHSGHSFLPEGNWFLAKANSPFPLLKSYEQSCVFDKKLVLSPRLIQNWWTRRKVRQEHGTERKINFPQWEKDYNLQPMNAYGLFDEYLEMSMEICLSYRL